MNKKTPLCNKGFTLIELIVVLMILVIAAVLGVSSLRGVALHAEQRARDDVARTLFMAAQTALTQRYNQNRNFYADDNSPLIPAPTDITPALSDAEQEKADAGKLVYLVSNPSSPSQTLLDWLSPQLNDKTILGNAILIEYNKETGRVLSAFYSEKELDGAPVKLGYSGAYDVHARDASAREAGFVGYYGVDDTGMPIRNNPIDAGAFAIVLKDYMDYRATMEPYGVLAAEITLPIEGRDPSFAYTLTLTGTEGTRPETLTFSDAPSAEKDFTLTELLACESIDSAMSNPHTRSGGRRVIAYGEARSAGTTTLVIVLDAAQPYGATANCGIRTNYPGAATGFLDASLTISDGADTVVLYSDEDVGATPVHALYGGVTDSGAYKIASVRHLNNLRYCDKRENQYVQTASLFLQNYKREPLNFTPICNRLDPRADELTGEAYGFVGTFFNTSADYGIYDLHVDVKASSAMNLRNAGLFDTIANGGQVCGLRFASARYDADKEGYLVLPTDSVAKTATITGLDAAGGIAAVNYGTVSGCTVLGSVTANADGNSDAGGVVGDNAAGGSVSNCFAAVEVHAGRYAGGIAGYSAGEVASCEAGTASWRSSTDASRLYLTGMPFAGARHSAPISYRTNRTANNTFRIVLERDDGASGGIVGALTKSGSVTDCVNACKVEAGNETDGGGGAHSGGRAGGIAGYVLVDNDTRTAINYCSNAGAVYATASAGGIIGELNEGAMANCYNTGYVNRELTANTGVVTVGTKTYYLPGTPRNIADNDNSAYQSGGLVGYASSANIAVRNCYSAQYTGTKYGGAFGVINRGALTPEKIYNCCYLKNVLNGLNADALSQYYTENSSGGTPRLYADTNHNVRAYTYENLRKAPDESNLDSTIFANGSADGAGTLFGYTCPTLSVAEGKASYLHRTPYNPVLENYGTIKLAEHASGGTGPNDKYYTATFTLTPDKEARIRFIARRSNGQELLYEVPIFEGNFADLHRRANGEDPTGEQLYVYGYLGGYNGQSVDATEDLTLKITATKTDDGDYRYVIYFDYLTTVPRSYPDRLPDDMVSLDARLYSSVRGWATDAWVAHDYLELTSRITLQGEIGIITEGRELCFMLYDDTPTKITFDYEDGTKKDQSIDISTSDWKNVPKSYSSAIADFWLYRKALPLKTEQGGNKPWNFPYYITGSGDTQQLHIVLWWWTSVSYNKPNNLSSADSKVTVSVYSGQGNSETLLAQKTFAKLEA